jgi:predicted amidophosphoribosyltransferase
MLTLLWHGLQDLISQSPCPRCRQALPSGTQGPSLCDDCLKDLELPRAGLQGQRPLAWWALGWYEGQLRRLLLQLRPDPRAELIEALAEHLTRGLACNLSWRDMLIDSPPVLVAIPSWKRSSNPLPGRLSAALSHRLGCRELPLLRRSRPTLGQHHLNRSLRQKNQEGSFSVLEQAPKDVSTVVLIDDILTSGATANAAAQALAAEGWPVAGVLCLARTPRRPAGRDGAMV